MVGTPLYMSPEQVELTGMHVDPRCDICSMGALRYELVTGSTSIRFYGSDASQFSAFSKWVPRFWGSIFFAMLHIIAQRGFFESSSV